MLYSKVINNQVVSEKPFTLPLNYTDEYNNTHSNVEKLGILEKMTLGLFPTVITEPSVFDDMYFEKRPLYVIGPDSVSLSYDVVPIAVTKDILDRRLIDFAKTKDIDIQEIPMLLLSNNLTWQAEATVFQNLYIRSWEAFYSGAELPVLAWS
jgi:hypothetical protein